MALFNFFNSKKNDNSINSAVDVIDEQEEKQLPAMDGTEDGEEKKKNFITITWGTGMPIDIIFNFIHKDFEEDGFQDALVNSDISYRDAKVKIIRNDLEMLFKRIILRYKNDIREIAVNISNAQKACALSAADRLQARRETYEEHLSEISEMQQLLMADDPKMTTMIESYCRGFMKGMSAVAINFIDKK